MRGTNFPVVHGTEHWAIPLLDYPDIVSPELSAKLDASLAEIRQIAARSGKEMKQNEAFIGIQSTAQKKDVVAVRVLKARKPATDSMCVMAKLAALPKGAQ
ncbi:hypothetical protein HOS33_gp328 [Erwinia phage vB_EamM_Y3]|uniref:Uncharacterized protein n=1 Tax=Erwinia phage vB_EamM_Y3 TaxID=1983553 RepID=A0A2H4IBP5_9CAUD|nr:hypothetical protein HOS33_gp328 [Erwinia phage vB_EamM_Y3]ARW58968.1 hypothetical protein Y3_328 [Erwinia phage vB_EamM_Y3]